MTVSKFGTVLFLLGLITLPLSTGTAPVCAAAGDGSPDTRITRRLSPRSVVVETVGSGNRSRPATIGETFRNAIPDSREIIRDIVPWNWDRYGIALGIGAATLPLYFAKDDIQGAIGLEDGGDPLPMEEFAFVENKEFPTRYEFLGNTRTIPALSGAFVLGGVLLRSPREVETGLMLFESLLFTAAVTGLGQLVLAEERPYQGGELKFFRTHGHGVSGHSSVSASMVWPLDRQYLRIEGEDGKAMVTAKYVGKGILFTAPVMVGISRVRSNRHYLWNVILGLAVGYSVGKVVADVHDQPVSAADPGSGSWVTRLKSQGTSLSFEW